MNSVWLPRVASATSRARASSSRSAELLVAQLNDRHAGGDERFDQVSKIAGRRAAVDQHVQPRVGQPLKTVCG